LFSVVQFPNDVCTTTSGTYTNGTCITSSECANNGGTSQGTCAAGFGVCCVYTYTTSGSIITQNVSYVVNPSYPSNYAPSSTPATVTYTVNKASCDVCRLRLDFEAFQLTAPELAANPRGKCSTDYMILKTTAHQTVSSASGNYGNYPYLCGTNAGQHAYLDMSCTCTDTATIDIVVGDAVTNTWKVKITQYSCDDPDVASSEGCFQYFTGESGSFESFGLASSSMICGHNYATCIRPLDGYCCIEYTPTTWDLGAMNPATPATSAVDCDGATATAATACTSAQSCQKNFVIIPGAISPQTCKNDGTLCFLPPNGPERYCGTMLIPEGHVDDAATGTRLNTIKTCQRPFRTFASTGDCGSPTDTDFTSTGISAVSNTDGDEGVTGWAFTYRQLPGGC